MSVTPEEVATLNANLNALLAATGRLREAGVEVPVEITSGATVADILRKDAAHTFFKSDLGAAAMSVEFEDGTVITRAEVGL